MNKANKQQVPKIRFKEFSDKWEQQKLGDISNRISSGKDKQEAEGVYDLYGSTGVIGKSLLNSYLGNYILIARVGANAGYLQNISGEFSVTDNTLVLDLKDRYSINFTFYLLTRFNLNRLIFGSGQPLITGGQLKDLSLFFTDKKEQTQIGNFFQQLDKLIELQTRAVESAETYKKAMLQKMFPLKGEKVPCVRFEGFSGDWEEKTIGDIADIKRGASPRPISDPKWFNDSSSIGWVRISDVTRSFRILEKTEQYLSAEGVKRSRFIKSGSIIMSICATIGKPVYTAFDVCIHDGFVVFDSLKIDEDYTLYFLQTIQEKWYQYGQPGTQVNLNSDIVSQEKIVYPSVDEQVQVGNFFQKLDQNIESEKKKLEQYQTMKRAMLQRMFV